MVELGSTMHRVQSNHCSQCLPRTLHRRPATVPRAPDTTPKVFVAVPKPPAMVRRAPATRHRAPTTVHREPATMPREPAYTCPEHNDSQLNQIYESEMIFSSLLSDIFSFIFLWSLEKEFFKKTFAKCLFCSPRVTHE